MPRPKAPEGVPPKQRGRKNRKRGAKESGAASSPAAAPSSDAPAEPTVEALIQGLEKARRLAIKNNRATTAVNATVAIARLMPQPNTPEGDRRRRGRRCRKTDAQENGTASSPAAAPSDDAPMELTVDALIRGLDKARRFAIQHNRAAAAVNATIAIARLLGFLPDTPGRPPSPNKAGRAAAPPAKFDGNYNDAARRIAFLLRLAEKENADEAEKPETPGKANGQKRDRQS
jgi:hypothetical protein